MVAMAIAGLALGTTACEDEDTEDLQGNWYNTEAEYPGVVRGGAVSFKIEKDGKEYVLVGTGANTNKTVERERFRDFYHVSLDNANTQLPTWSVAWSDTSSYKNDFVVGGVRPMPSEAAARNGAVAFTLNGKGYVGLGYDGTHYLNDFWEYNPEDNSWSKVAADYPDSLRFAVAFVIDNVAYVGTGEDYDYNYVNKFYKFDGTKWEAVATKKTKVSQASAFTCVASDGLEYGYVVGGKGTDGASYMLERYDPRNNTWTTMNYTKDHSRNDFDDNYTLSSYGHTVFVLYPEDPYQCRVYLTTGGASSAAGKATWEYFPAYDYWVQRTAFEGSSRKFAVSFTLRDRSGKDHGFVSTGTTGDMTISGSSASFYGDTWLFNPNAPYEYRD